MKVRLFSKDSDPATDSPLCHKSHTYVQSLIDAGEAIMLNDRSAQLTGWLRMRRTDPLESLTRAAGGRFDSAWSIRQSGFDGPLVWQLNAEF